MDKTLETIWNTVLLEMKKDLSRANYVTLFTKTALISLEESTATIAAESVMTIDLLQKRFIQRIKESLDTQTGKNITILFVPQTIHKEAPTKPIEAGPLFTQETTNETKPFVGHLARVRPEFTFQNFAVSGSNQLAFVSATAVAKSIGHTYNPFFIYGPVGVGKTHLMHAIANDCYQKNPDKKIIYITSEEFTNEVVEAIRNNDTSRMKKRFRSAILLLIDDIQFIEGKERVQEELFHTFNILIDNNSQIVLSSDRPPHEIKKLEKRLSSRFAGGLTVDVQAPDFELKTAILLIKAKKYGVELPIDVAKLIADNANDTRSLEGLLLRIITQAKTKDQEISIEMAKQALGKAEEESRGHLHAEDVIKDVCTFYNIKATQIKGPKREASLVKARQIAMYLLKTELKMTYVEIGNVLGGRDHTTVIHGVEKMEHLVDNKANIIEDIKGITQRLHG